MPTREEALRELQRVRARMELERARAQLASESGQQEQPIPSEMENPTPIFPESDRPHEETPEERATRTLGEVYKRAEESVPEEQPNIGKLGLLGPGLTWALNPPRWATETGGKMAAGLATIGEEASKSYGRMLHGEPPTVESMEKAAAGTRVLGEGAAPALLTAVGGMVGGEAVGAYKTARQAGAGAIKALKTPALIGAVTSGEMAVGMGAEYLTRKGLEKLGVPPNTAASLSNILTMPVSLTGTVATAGALRGKAAQAIEALKASRFADDTAKAAAREAAESVAKEASAAAATTAAAEPTPGIPLAPARQPVKTAVVPEAVARQARVDAIDREIADVVSELTAKAAQNPDTMAVYQARLNDLKAQREAAAAPTSRPPGLPEPTRPITAGSGEPPPISPEPKVVSSAPLSREQARAEARRVAERLRDPELDDVAREQLLRRQKELRNYGEVGLEDQPVRPALDEGAPPLPRTLTEGQQKRFAKLEGRALELRKKAEALSPAEDAELGQTLLELNKLRGEELPPPRSPAQTEAQLFPEPLGQPASGTLPPDLPYAPRRALAGRLAAARTRAVAAKAAGKDTSKLDLLVQDLETAMMRQGSPQPATQDRIESPEQAPLFQEGVDLAIRPEQPVYSSELPPGSPGAAVRPEPPLPRTAAEATAELETLAAAEKGDLPPGERHLIEQRREAIYSSGVLSEPLPVSPRRQVEDLGYEPREVPAEESAGVLIPSKETIELNYPDLKGRLEAYRTSKNAADKARAQAALIRQSLETNQELTPALRAKLEKKLASLESKQPRETLEPYAKLAEKTEETATSPERSFLNFLVGDAKKKAEKLPEPPSGISREIPAQGRGRTQAKKWRDPVDVSGRARRYIQESTPLAAKQAEARLQSLEAQLAEAASNPNRELGPLVNAVEKARADAAALYSSRAGDSGVAYALERSDSPVSHPEPSDIPPLPGRTPKPSMTLREKVAYGVQSLVADMEWNFRNLHKEVQTVEGAEAAKPRLGEIADRYRRYVVAVAQRYGDMYSRLLKIGGRKSKLGLEFLSEPERINFTRAAEGQEPPMNESVAAVLRVWNEVRDEIADSAEMSVLTFDPELGGWRPFSRRKDFVPHFNASPRALELDEAVRDRVVENMTRKFGISEGHAQQMIAEWVTLHKSKSAPSKGSLLAGWLVETHQVRTPEEALARLQELAKPTVGRSSSLEYARSGLELPFQDPDIANGLAGWLRHTVERLTWIEEFGQDIPSDAKIFGELSRPARLADTPQALEKNEKVFLKTLGELLDETTQAGGQALTDKARKKLNVALDAIPDREWWANLTRFMRQLGGFKLGYLATDNYFQGALGSMLRGNVESTFHGLLRAHTDEAWNLATRSGSLRVGTDLYPIYYGGDDFAPGQLQTALDAFSKFARVKQSEDFNRLVTSSAAGKYIDQLYQELGSGAEPWKLGPFSRDRVSFARRELQKLDLPVNRAPTDDEMLRGIFRFDRDVNFENDNWLKPEITTGEGGKMMFQFYNWNYQQTRLLYNETWKRIMDGKRTGDLDELARGVRNLMTLVTLYPAVGTLARIARAGLKSAGHLAAEELGIRQDEPSRLEQELDAWNKSPGTQMLRGGLRMGMAPMPLGDILESEVGYGQAPSLPNIAGASGDVPWDIVVDPTINFVGSVWSEYDKPFPHPSRHVGPYAADVLKGVITKPVPLVGDQLEPFLKPVDRALRR